MYQNVSFCDFCDAFRDHDRNDSFSYDGKRALFNYFEDMDYSCGESTELDIVAIDCEFCEYLSAVEAIAEYETDDYTEDEALEYFRDRTTIIEFQGGVIIGEF